MGDFHDFRLHNGIGFLDVDWIGDLVWDVDGVGLWHFVGDGLQDFDGFRGYFAVGFSAQFLELEIRVFQFVVVVQIGNAHQVVAAAAAASALEPYTGVD